MAGIDSYVQLMLHGWGTNGSTTFVDDSQNNATITHTGSVAISTAEYEFTIGQGAAAQSSIGFNQSAQSYLTAPYNSGFTLGSSDFTVDCWVYLKSLTTQPNIIFARVSSGSSYVYWQITNGTNEGRFSDFNGSYNLNCQGNGPGTNGVVTVTTPLVYTISLNTWTHVALERYGNIVTFYQNGVIVGKYNITPSLSLISRSSVQLDVGAMTQNSGYYLDGYMSEFRYSVGIARYLSTPFTPPTSPYTSSGVPVTSISPSTFDLTTTLYSPSIRVSSTVSPATLELTSTLYNPIAGQLTTVNPATLDLTTTLYSPSLVISSTINPSTLHLTSELYEPVILPPSSTSISLATKILAYTTNKLVIVGNTNPVQVCFVNTSSPSSPTYVTHIYSGTADAQDITYSSITGKLYVACADGIMLEIIESTPTSFTINNTGSNNNLTSINILPSFFDIYASTNENSGEMISMYEGVSSTIATDMRFRQTVSSTLGTRLNTANGQMIGSDIRFSATISNTVGCDIRFIDQAFSDLSINPISRTDFVVLINDVEVSDVSLESIEITHTADEKSMATFRLARKHDQLDYMLDGSSSPISNNPSVKILINGNEEFGYDTPAVIWDIDTKSESETVKIVAYSELPKQDVRSTVTLSIPGLNEKLHVYHTIMDDPVIDNAYLLPDDPTPPFYEGILIDTGYQELQYVTQLINQFQFGTQSSTQRVNYILGSGDSGIYDFNGDSIYFKPDPNYTYFWFVTGTNFLTGETLAGVSGNAGVAGGADFTSNLAYIGTSLSPITSDAWNITDINYWAQRVYPYTKLRGPMPGVSIVYGSDLFGVTIFDESILRAHSQTDYNGSDIDTLRFSLITASNPQNIGFTTGAYNALNASTKLLDIIDSKFGVRFGVGPWKKVSSKNGWKAPTLTWEDQADGLYVHEDAGYNYIEYINRVGQIELTKIQNINGSILPKTKCDLQMFLDGYYHFGIELLMRINIDNTTTANIYDNNNGFPCSVKSIHISAKDMKVTLSTSNEWSRYELLAMEALMPDPNQYTTFEERVRIAQKINPATLTATT